jgi:Domain of unknown function (DUF397)
MSAELAYALGKDGVILVRDTTDRDGGALAFGAETWQTFVTGLKTAGRSKSRSGTNRGSLWPDPAQASGQAAG